MANFGVSVILLVFIGGFCSHATSLEIIEPVDTVFKVGQENKTILNCTVTPAEEVETLQWTFGDDIICNKTDCNGMYNIEEFDLVALKTTFDTAGLYTCSFVVTTTDETTDPSTSTEAVTDPSTSTEAVTEPSTSTAAVTEPSTSTTTVTEPSTSTTTVTEPSTTDSTDPSTTSDPATTKNKVFNKEDTFVQNNNHNYSAEVNIIGDITCPEKITMKHWDTKTLNCSVQYAGSAVPTLDFTRNPEKTYFKGREEAFRHKRSEETRQVTPLSKGLTFENEDAGVYTVSCKVSYLPGLNYEEECTSTVTVENAGPSVTPGLGLILATLLSAFYQRLM